MELYENVRLKLEIQDEVGGLGCLFSDLLIFSDFEVGDAVLPVLDFLTEEGFDSFDGFELPLLLDFDALDVTLKVDDVHIEDGLLDLDDLVAREMLDLADFDFMEEECVAHEADGTLVFDLEDFDPRDSLDFECVDDVVAVDFLENPDDHRVDSECADGVLLVFVDFELFLETMDCHVEGSEAAVADWPVLNDFAVAGAEREALGFHEFAML